MGRFNINNILLVEDENELAKTLKRHLKREGFSVVVASDGKTAIKVIEDSIARGVHFELVISDVVMPNMDGIELIRWIKNQHPEVSVVLLSGFGDLGSVVETIRPNLDDYFQKPLTPTDMMNLIERIDFKRKRLENQTAL
ncbi:MAG TPA: response regulator [Smithellaceae bacterium]|nr:response regulator [Smithellaceae bacterium]